MGNYGVMTIGMVTAASWLQQHGAISPYHSVYGKHMDEQLEDKLRSELSAELNKISPPAQMRRRISKRHTARPSWLTTDRTNRLAGAMAVVAVLLVGVAIWQSVTGAMIVATVPALTATTVPADGFVRFPGWSTSLAFDYPANWHLISSVDLTSPDDTDFAVLTDLAFATSPEAADRLYQFEEDDVYVEIQVVRPNAPAPTRLDTIYGFFIDDYIDFEVLQRLPNPLEEIVVAQTNHDATRVQVDRSWAPTPFLDSRTLLFMSSDSAYQSAAIIPGPTRDVVFFTGNRHDSNITLTAFAAPGRGERLAYQVVELLNSVHDVPLSPDAFTSVTEPLPYEFLYPADWERVDLSEKGPITRDAATYGLPALPDSVGNSVATDYSDLPTAIFSVNGAAAQRDVTLDAEQAVVTLLAQPFENASVFYVLPFSPNLGMMVAEFSPDNYHIITPPREMDLGHFQAELAVVASGVDLFIPTEEELEAGMTLHVRQVPPAEFVMIQAEDGERQFSLVGMAAPGQGEQLSSTLIQMLISAEPVAR